MKFRAIQYPQLKRLPSGTRAVKQDGWEQHKCKYAFFIKDGCLVMPFNTKSLREAKKRALDELNERIRYVALMYESPTMQQQC